MTMILTRVTMVGWAGVSDSNRGTSDVGVPSTYLVKIANVIKNYDRLRNVGIYLATEPNDFKLLLGE